MDENKIIEKFNEYVSKYDKGIMEISLKYNHSFEVMRLMGEIGFRLGLSENDIKLARFIGLIHDIGRFEQYQKYHVFSDKYSDHADESCIYLFDLGHIRDFIDDKQYDLLIEKAIRYHNKISLPDDLTAREKLFCQMLRDMDKVDIYKQVAVNYNFLFNADNINVEVLEDFYKERLIDVKKTNKDSNYIILLLAWVYDFNYNDSFDILVETDNFDLFLSTIEVDSNSEKLWRKLREVCFGKINRGIDIK